MARVEFGFSLGTYPLGLPDPDEIYRLGELVEETGFDSVALGDHLVMGSPQLESMTTLTAYAGRTKRIKLIEDVYILPLRTPAVAAKVATSVDYLSKGRLILGVGVGGEHPKEFEVCGVPLKQRGRRCDEAIQVMKKLWAAEPASHHGEFWQFDNINMQPKPVQPGGPPIWIGGRSDKALSRAARLGDGWIAYMIGHERYRTGVDKIRQFAADSGRDLSGFTLAHHQFICVDRTFESARDKAVDYLTRTYNQPFQGIAEKYCALGTVEDCVRWLERFAALGVKHVVLRATCPPNEISDQMNIYAREILPAFR